ncbi:MAG: hypothetical protein WDM91_17530 [Rhizomicrobium sp.]
MFGRKRKQNFMLADEQSAFSAPLGTPLGIPALGIQRYRAFRELQSHAIPALRDATEFEDAISDFLDARAKRAQAYVRFTKSNELLDNLDLICEGVRMQVLAEYHEQRRRLKDATTYLEVDDESSVEDAAQDVVAVAELTNAARKAKARIIDEAGGEDYLADVDRDALDTIDAYVTAAATGQLSRRLR